MRRRLPWLTLLLALVPLAPSAEADAGDWWFGGGLGLSFGDVDYVSVEPVIGYSATPELSLGARLIYRYRNDGRFGQDISTSDYGGGLFARYLVARPLFLQAEYEYLDYEYAFSDGSTVREGYDSVLGGVGVLQPIGRSTAFFATVLYNFNWSADEPSPYAERWVVRAGVTLGF